MIKRKPSRETLIYVGLWTAFFLIPVVSFYFRSTVDRTYVFRWGEIFPVWMAMAFYLVIFIFHDLVLAPMLIYREKHGQYLLSMLILFSAFVFILCVGDQGDHPHGPGPDGSNPPVHGQFMPPPRDHQNPLHTPLGPEPIVNSLLLLGLLGLNLGVKLYFKNERDRASILQLEKTRLEQQLEYLKYQINPHFFMNTLNNIQVLVDMDPEAAKAALRELSVMMRFILYEGDKAQVPLQKEITFLRNYVRLMRLRYDERLTVTMDIPENMPDILIPPLLFVTFVENSFKHGVSSRHGSFITISMDIEDGQLLFYCMNSKREPSRGETEVPSEGGVGLKNVRRRLDLIYGSDYTLTIEDGKEVCPSSP